MLVENSMVNNLRYIFSTFGDSVQEDTIKYLWNTFRKQSPESFITSNEPLLQNISVMAAVLENRGYTVVTEQPDNYESIYALSKLPVLIWTLIIHHPDKKSTLITDKNLTLHKTSQLASYINDVHLHLITRIAKSDEIYKITTYDGLTFSGRANDNLNAQILTGDTKEGTGYIQIIDCFFISSLPILEIEHHIDEWYSRTPYNYTKPKIKEM